MWPAELRAKRGQMLVLVAVMLMAMIAILGLVLDSGLVHAARRQARRAADAAAQAGALVLCSGTNTTQIANATIAARLYASTNGINTNNVTVQIPPGAGSNSIFAGSNGYIFVQVILPVNTTFLRLLSAQHTVNVTAAATAGAPPSPIPVTLEALNPTMDGALSLQGNASINLPNAAIAVNSSDSHALKLIGNAQITASAINVVGNVSGGKSGNISGTLNTGVPATGDPLANVPEPVLTSSTTVTYGDGTTATTSPDSAGTAFGPTTTSFSAHATVTLHPGIYWGGISLSANATATFLPGRYVLAGGGLSITGNADASGTNVFFYNTNDSFAGGGSAACGNISITGNGTVNFTAPTANADATYSGLVFFNNRTSTTQINFTGNGSTGIGTGYIYAKSGVLNVDGNGSVGNFGAIVDHATFVGNATLNAPDLAHTPSKSSVQLVE